MPNKQRGGAVEPLKERKPIPPRGHRWTDKKKAASKKAARRGKWGDE